MELEDIKYIAAFVLFPCLLFFSLRHYPREAAPATPLRGERVYWLLFFAFVAYSFCNWYILSRPYFGTRSMAYLWFCFLSFLLGVFFLSKPKNFTAFYGACGIVGVIASLYSFGEYTALIPFCNPEAWPPRITGLFAHKNAFALFIMNSSIWTCSFLYNAQKKWRVYLIILLLLQLFTLLISDCRGVLILTGLGFLGIFIPLSIKNRFFKNPKNRYVLYAILFFCMTIPLFIWDDYFWSRMANLALSAGGEVTTRQALYRAEWKLFLAHPVFGCGVGNFIYDNIPFWSESFRKTVDAFFFARNAESDFFEILTETGIIGFAFYCFFLLGAVFLGFRELKREWKGETHIVLVLFILMLCNGIYDAAPRRLPCAIILWSYAGYLWRSHFIATWRDRSSKTWFALNASVFMIHCMLAVFFLRILAGDFFYIKSFITKKNPHPQSGRLITQALAVCPFHPDALYQAAYMGIRTKEFDYVNRVAGHLDQTAPNYRPTNFLKGLCALEQKQYADALAFANEEIARNPNYLSPYELKVKAFAGLGRCGEMSRLRDSLCLPLKDEKNFIHWGDTISSSTLKKDFIDQTGKLRAWVGGYRLKEAYRRYVTINRNKNADSYAQLHRILNVSCGKEPAQ